MSETPQEAQQGVADALHELSDNSRALVRHEISAAQTEMWEKAKQALPAAGLLAVASVFGVLSVAASYRLSIRLLEKSLSPALAAFTAAAGYGTIAGVAGAIGYQELRQMPPLIPSDTARASAQTVADAASRAASGQSAAPRPVAEPD